MFKYDSIGDTRYTGIMSSAAAFAKSSRPPPPGSDFVGRLATEMWIARLKEDRTRLIDNATYWFAGFVSGVLAYWGGMIVFRVS